MFTGEHNNQLEAYTVSQLNREVHSILQENFPLVSVQGEISNLVRPKSGHLYFTLKDENAQVRCAMFRNRNLYMDLKPENGMLVQVRAKISLYEPRGDYQLIIEHMEDAGAGALQRAFEALKKKLAAEGLFDSAAKQNLPGCPAAIGVVTSPSGAAIRDILKVLGRRFPAIPVVIYPCAVQGKSAAAEIVQAMNLAEKRQECEVLILARGGGSLEDLWPFNEEIVARKVAACPIPVISGVGHEIDFTIVDFVADARAPTPSAAAEMATPDRQEWLQHLNHLRSRLHQLMDHGLKQLSLKLLAARRQLVHPQRKLHQHVQRLDELEQRLFQAWTTQFQRHVTRLNSMQRHLLSQSPQKSFASSHKDLIYSYRRLETNMKHILHEKKQLLGTFTQTLHTVSPLATLQRGYAIVLSPADQKIIRYADEVTVGDEVETRLSQGHLFCEVKRIIKPS